MATAKGKRILTARLLAQTGVVVHGETITVVTAHVFQQDVTVIAVSINLITALPAACLAEAGSFLSIGEVTRAAIVRQPGGLLFVNTATSFLAAAPGGAFDLASYEHIVFPEGYGVDFDEGEPINCIAQHQSGQAAVDTQQQDTEAIIYYVIQ